jgi:dTDP-4-dehydrorhamnose reductase
MRLAVSGGQGQVGQEFRKRVDNDKLVPLGHDRIEVEVEKSVYSCLKNLDFDTVINLAAFHNTDQCEVEKEKAFLVNTIGAYNVAKVARELNKKVVFVSTDYVFGLDTTRDKPYLESDTVAPLNVYGASKAAGEMMVRIANDNHLIVRTSSLYGAVTSKKGWTFPEMIYQKARAGEPLKVVNDQIMSPTYTGDVVRTILGYLEKDATGTFHIAGGGQCSWYDLACATLQLLDIDCYIEPVSSSSFPAKAKRPKYSVLDSMHFARYEITPPRQWQNALEEYLKEKGEL